MIFGSRKGSSKKPRFFCESCGTEVPRDARNCPKCGRYFASVRCPSCEFTGEETLFKGGCPVCGYSSGTSPGSAGGFLDFPASKKPAGPLPLWVYVLTGAAFFGILAALFLTLF